MNPLTPLKKTAFTTFGAFALRELELASDAQFNARTLGVAPKLRTALLSRRVLARGLEASGYKMVEFGTAWSSVLAALPAALRRSCAKPVVRVFGFDAVSSSVEIWKKGESYALLYPDSTVRYLNGARALQILAR